MLSYSIAQLFQYVFPPHCLVCSTPGSWICAPCQRQYLVRSPPECPVCRKVSTDFKTHRRCRRKSNLTQLIVGWRYGKAARRIMQLFKGKLAYSIAKKVTDLYAPRLNHYLTPGTILVPVPSDTSRIRERGFNQSEMLARMIGNTYSIPVLSLLKRKPGKHQTGKSAHERRQLGSDVYSCTQDASLLTNNSGKIVIVDDVCTTGTTLERCAEALSQKVSQEISGLVLFRGKPVKRRSKAATGTRST